MKICTKCEPPKLFSEFHKDASTKDGYKHQCIECREPDVKKTAKRHYDKYKEKYAAQHLANNPPRARRQSVYRGKIDRAICSRCGQEFTYIRITTARGFCDMCTPMKEQHWQDTHRERMRELNAAREKRDRLKVNARKLVQQYIRKGKMQRLPCEMGGDPTSQAYHSDHSKPVEIG
jgi:hypothetical protein